jgi:hypothetical protein
LRFKKVPGGNNRAEIAKRHIIQRDTFKGTHSTFKGTIARFPENYQKPIDYGESFGKVGACQGRKERSVGSLRIQRDRQEWHGIKPDFVENC